MTVIDLPTSIDKQSRLRAIARRKAAQRATDIEHGAVAWNAFNAARRDKLGADEREIIARNMWREIESFKRNGSSVTLGELLETAAIRANHLPRLILAPGKPAAELRAYPSQYIDLLHALEEHTGENKMLIADRVLIGTRFHPVSLTNLQEAQLILEALQVAVDRIDEEFNLWEQCQVVAAIRKPLEAHYFDALQQGDEAAVAAFWEANPAPLHSDPIKLWWPLEDGRLDDYEGNWLTPVNPFWIRTFDGPDAAGACCREEIFFFPHVYLGAAIQWDSYRDGIQQPELTDEDKESIRTALEKELVPGVLFDEASKTYQVYEEPNPGTKRISGDDWDWGSSGYMDSVARWLIIYPDPDAKRLVPALFTRGDLFFTQLEPLTARLIAELGDSQRWELHPPDGKLTLLQRLRDLTGYGTGDFKIMDAWRESAARFHLNPIFRSHPGEAEVVLYRRHLERWIRDGGVALNRDS